MDAKQLRARARESLTGNWGIAIAVAAIAIAATVTGNFAKTFTAIAGSIIAVRQTDQ